MNELDNTELMILRGKLSTLRRDDRSARKEFANACAAVSNAALNANRLLNEGNIEAAGDVINSVPTGVAQAAALIPEIKRLAEQMDELRDAWQG